MLCQILLQNEVNQLHVYIYPLPLEPVSHHPALSCPSRSSQSTKLSNLCCTADSHQLSILHMLVCICQYYSLSSFQSLLPPVSACPFSTSASVNHKEKNKYRILMYIYGIQKKWCKLTYLQSKNRGQNFFFFFNFWDNIQTHEIPSGVQTNAVVNNKNFGRQSVSLCQLDYFPAKRHI